MSDNLLAISKFVAHLYEFRINSRNCEMRTTLASKRELSDELNSAFKLVRIASSHALGSYTKNKIEYLSGLISPK